MLLEKMLQQFAYTLGILLMVVLFVRGKLTMRLTIN